MSKIRPVAFYLPQYHPIPENNLWWGKGFTEWTNVAKAKPLFKGHYQPHLPADLGYYDLRIAEVREEQARMAREHGIYGFCYYHYWFNGTRLLERPFSEVAESGKPDFPFMLCWANENWSRTWDGGDNEILMKQEYSEQDAESHSRLLLQYFKDSRYIKVDGKPVFVIYKPNLITNLEAYVRVLRREAEKEGLFLYLCRVENENKFRTDILSKQFDAAIEFQPQSEILYDFMHVCLQNKIHNNLKQRIYNKVLRSFGYGSRVRDIIRNSQWNLNYSHYVDYVRQHYEYPKEYKRFPGVTPMWDNTARRGRDSFLFYNATPQKYQQWLQYHLQNFKPYSRDENFIFINAWNEWAEGNHLEPCREWGNQYLQATKEILQKHAVEI